MRKQIVSKNHRRQRPLGGHHDERRTGDDS